MSRSNNPLAGQDAPVPSILRGDSPAACARYFRICKQKATTAARMGDRPLAAFWTARALETGMATDEKAVGARATKLENAVRWALGEQVEGIMDFAPPASGKPRYWWRGPLAALAFGPEPERKELQA